MHLIQGPHLASQHLREQSADLWRKFRFAFPQTQRKAFLQNSGTDARSRIRSDCNLIPAAYKLWLQGQKLSPSPIRLNLVAVSGLDLTTSTQPCLTLTTFWRVVASPFLPPVSRNALVSTYSLIAYVLKCDDTITKIRNGIAPVNCQSLSQMSKKPYLPLKFALKKYTIGYYSIYY